MFIDKNETGVFAPAYYSTFRCIADRCRHSCCIDWEICIDDITYEKYKQMEDILGTITASEDGSPCFALRENGRCPHLNDEGLCQIILSHGDAFLSDICVNHPRFYHYITDTKLEAGLGLVCEEACRLILEEEAPFSLLKIGEIDEEETGDFMSEFDPLPLRARIFSVIEAKDCRFDEKISALKTEFAIPEVYTKEEWLDRFLSLEMLDREWETTLRSIQGKVCRSEEEMLCRYGSYYERLLTYFVYRHVSTAVDENDLRARLGFAILSAEMIRALFEATLTEKMTSVEGVPEALIDLARRYSAEIEYSEDNTAELIFLFESKL